MFSKNIPFKNEIITKPKTIEIILIIIDNTALLPRIIPFSYILLPT